MPADSALKRLAQMSNPGRWYLSALEGAQEYTGPVREDPGWFHPSGLSEECDANLAFHYLGAPSLETITARTRRIFDNGSGRDEYLKRDSIRAGVSLVKEYREPITCPSCKKKDVWDNRHICIPSLRIRGDLDDWAQNYVTKTKYVIDFKTMRSDLWKVQDKVNPGHHIQVHPYMVAKDTYEGYVLYENKDTQEQKLHPANFENLTWQGRIVDRIGKILEDLDKGYVVRNPVNCSRCPFFENGTCGRNNIAELKEASGLYVRS